MEYPMTTELLKIKSAMQNSVAGDQELELDNDEVCLARLAQVVGLDASIIKLVFGGTGCLPPPSQDRERFIGFVKLVVDRIGVADEIALLSVRDFALAELGMHYWAQTWELMLCNKRRAYMRQRIEVGLRQEGVSDADINEQTKLLLGQYADLRTQRHVVGRFSSGPDQMEAEIIQSALAEAQKVEQRLSHHRRQRDLAIKSLGSYNKFAAQRLREIARLDEQARAQIGVANINPAPALTRT
jgi:hypothetical protein